MLILALHRLVLPPCRFLERVNALLRLVRQLALRLQLRLRVRGFTLRPV